MAQAAPGAPAEELTGDVAEAAARVLASAGGCIPAANHRADPRRRKRWTKCRVLVLHVAQRPAGWGQDWVFLSGGTDGRDGPTDAAGGMVDAGTVARMGAAGATDAPLDTNDSYRALEAAGDLLMTGPTGTNVADLQVLIRGA
ncbi:MAG: MOFRL family protein [Paracoccaceae bacterium]